ncbi:hypothetical protein C8Q75DRAFT_743947 [Abortiporus biennis]|nr:hypothetical protein C8Q75DRAFT_743947 [Abortiporus biennis]
MTHPPQAKPAQYDHYSGLRQPQHFPQPAPPSDPVDIRTISDSPMSRSSAIPRSARTPTNVSSPQWRSEAGPSYTPSAPKSQIASPRVPYSSGLEKSTIPRFTPKTTESPQTISGQKLTSRTPLTSPCVPTTASTLSTPGRSLRTTRAVPSRQQSTPLIGQSPRFPQTPGLTEDSRSGSQRTKSAKPTSIPNTPKSSLKVPSPLVYPGSPLNKDIYVPSSSALRSTLIPTSTHSSTSDLERRYERTFTGGRLVVANGSIASSSGSEQSFHAQNKWDDRNRKWSGHAHGSHGEEDSRTNTDQYSRKQPHPTPRFASSPMHTQTRQASIHSSESGVGLGLSIDTNPHNYIETEDESERSVFEDDEASVYDTDDDKYYQNSSLTSRQHLSVEIQHQNQSFDSARRQEALRGIVNGLRLECGSRRSSAAKSVVSFVESEADYSGQGVAIGDSEDLDAIGAPDGRRSGPRSSWNRSSQQSQGESKSHSRRVSRHSDYRQPDSQSRVSERKVETQNTSHVRSKSSAVDHSFSQRNRRSSSVPPNARSSQNYEQSVATPIEPRRDHERVDASQRRSRKRANTVAERPSSNDRRSSQARDPQEQHRNSTHHDAFERRTSANKWTEEASTRERNAFGIPSSLSYGANDSDPQLIPQDRSATNLSDAGLPHFDSQQSAVGDGQWSERINNHDPLSNGAEALFRKLSIPSQHNRRDRNSEGRFRANKYPASRPPDAIPEPVKPPSPPSVMSAASSAPSVYDDGPVELESPPHTAHNHAPHPRSTNAWQFAMHPSTYEALLKEYGPAEMERQELIYKFSCSEEKFVTHMHAILKQCILPLRRRNSKRWIPGVPGPVARLFDWLDDIVNLHTAVLSSLKSAQRVWKAGGVILRFGEIVRGYVPRLEIYQPYLVKLNLVKDLVLSAVRDMKDEFGEYVRLQEEAVGMNEPGWTLVDFLSRPMERLKLYPQAFTELCKSTPKTHCDYLPILSLSCSTRMIIRVLGEVRRREAEYQLVKELQTKIAGISPTVKLAARERRLLWQGEVSLSIPPDHPETCRDCQLHCKAPSLNTKKSKHSGIRKQEKPQRVTRLFDAIGSWNNQRNHRPRSSSFNSSVSSLLSDSLSSCYSSSSAASLPSTPRWEKRPYERTPEIVIEHPSESERSKVESRHHTHNNQDPVRVKQQATLAKALIFSDVIVFFTANHIGRRGGVQYKLLDDIGIVRICGINNDDQNGNQLDLLKDRNTHDSTGCSNTLDLLSLSGHELDTGVIPENNKLFRRTITLSSSPAPSCSSSRESFVTSLFKAHQHTIRSLSFPSHAGNYLAHGPQVDLELDTQRSVISIMTTGLPVPKSPSVQQLQELQKKEEQGVSNVRGKGESGGKGRMNEKEVDEVELEREERGWWAVRFQQVLREMQRHDPIVTLDDTVDEAEVGLDVNVQSLNF